jgi:Putative zinc-finger
VSCVAVRDRLPELAVHGLPARDVASIERHLGWCAACRKEAEDLRRAAAVLPYALAPSAPDHSLEERVVGLVRDAAGRRPPGRGTHTAVAALVAAMVAVSALGWGAVMAGRASRLSDQFHAVEAQQRETLRNFANLVQQYGTREGDALLGKLDPPIGQIGGGAALVLASPGQDIAMIQVIGMPVGSTTALPYTARLQDAAGHRLTVGKIGALNSGGSGQIARRLRNDLTSFTQVVVTDASGDVVLSGTMGPQQPVPSPSP